MIYSTSLRVRLIKQTQEGQLTTQGLEIDRSHRMRTWNKYHPGDSCLISSSPHTEEITWNLSLIMKTYINIEGAHGVGPYIY